jgi:hypothetical protein
MSSFIILSGVALVLSSLQGCTFDQMADIAMAGLAVLSVVNATVRVLRPSQRRLINIREREPGRSLKTALTTFNAPMSHEALIADNSRRRPSYGVFKLHAARRLVVTRSCHNGGIS